MPRWTWAQKARNDPQAMENFLTLMAAVLALMGSPGPVTLTSAAAGAAFERRTAIAFVLAMTSGTWTVIALVALGVGGLITAVPGAAPVIGVVAGAYILYLAWKIANAPPLGSLQTGASAPTAIEGYLLGISNIKAYGAMGALFSGFPLTGAEPLTENLTKGVLLAASALTINLTWMVAGARLARMMQSPRAARVLNVTMAVLLVLAVGAMMFL